MKSLWLTVVMVSVLAVNGFAVMALTYSGTPQYSVGSGANTAYVAVDFDFGTAFVFEYKWDGAGGVLWDAMSAMDAAGDLNIAATNWGELESPNYFIDTISYLDAAVHPYDSILWPYWNIFTSQDGAAWVSPATEGVSQIVVQNSGWYSLLWTYSQFDGSDYTPVRQPGSMPIPEPAAIAIMALGMVLARRRK